MSKNLCLYSFQTSSWISCQKIVANLWKNYKAASTTTTALHFGPEQKSQDLINLAQKIIDLKPNSISFIDHRPHPFELLQFLIPMWMKIHSTFPEVIFHIYGDFTLNYHRWAALSSLTKGVKVKFCVASSAQKKLIEKLIPGHVFILPFSVDESEFYYDQNLRQKVRSELKVTSSQKIFIFTGRLSYQKNIHLLALEFLNYIEKNNSDARLLIFGHFDDLGDTFTNYKPELGEYFHQVNSIIKAHPKRDQIKLMGMANSTELNGYYNASDFFINLSTHNDEDFGMSVAEASLCGLASILTSWGGLSDFNFSFNKYLKVSIDEKKEIDLTHFHTFLDQLINYDREHLSREAQQRFGSTQTTTELKNIIKNQSEEFTDFKDLFYKVQRKLLFTEKAYIDFDHKLNSLYKELYVSYLG